MPAKAALVPAGTMISGSVKKNGGLVGLNATAFTVSPKPFIITFEISPLPGRPQLSSPFQCNGVRYPGQYLFVS